MCRLGRESAAANLIPEKDYPKSGYFVSSELWSADTTWRLHMRPMNKIALYGILNLGLIGVMSMNNDALAQSATQKWKRIDAYSGAGMAIDLNSISHPHYTGGAADAIVCIVEENACTLLNQRRWRFDCRGRFMDIDRPSPLIFAPPQSVAGKLSEIACAGRKGG